MTDFPPRATYRLQFNRDFPFSAAEAIVPYLDRLGISHVYASPITAAVSGSPHGYDVIDPTVINPELGGEAGFRSLVDAVRARGMGMVIDIVPNHMGVAGGENGYWNDVLRHGAGGRYARWFDIDWDKPLLLPILGASLGEVIAAGDLELVDGALRLYGADGPPLRPDVPAQGDLRALVEAQHYRLASWRTANDQLNWRRFFTINELAGVRVEDPEVFEATHALYFSLFEQGLIDGVRVDHIDGLADPAGYARALRTRFDAIGGTRRAYIVVEKILAEHERLARDWGLDGTSGYDFMREVTGVLHASEGEIPLGELWEDISGRPSDFADEALTARQQLLSWQFAGQTDRCVAAFAALAASASASHPAFEAVTPAMLRRAIERLLWVFPVYRSYGVGNHGPSSDGAVLDRALADSTDFCPPGETEIARHIVEWLAGRGPGDATLAAEAVRRFQQLSAPIAAKAVEDTAFYRHGVLLSTNDVGFAPERFALDIGQFHAAMAARARDFPHAMLATATHDHKRGEDVRARLAALSGVPDIWAERVAGWMARTEGRGVDPADRYILLQTMFGAWPIDADRIKAWQTKALREAKLRSSWEAPDEAYEARAAELVDRLLADGTFTAEMEAFVRRLAPAATANSLAVALLRNTVPGVPDCYQGAELGDWSLVDPDNRRPVDYAARAALLERDGDPLSKPHLIARLLGLRRQSPALFSHGAYLPVTVSGPRAGEVLAFTRTQGAERLECAVLLKAASAQIGAGQASPGADWWGETMIDFAEPVSAAELFATAPYHINVAASAT
ncbi:malto-oligosyltrehalose synthase [Sphingomonas sp. NFR15]|uniref:malto-oligosyltrehalose synthase n=1 Tax=Sphingomonas sp. NFR15 TaxID=1566282 RepID=UPI00088382D6|nr:malto-oligosyltrehalose synthase [Sphingomonas sp. NFR15]SDA13200.1 (1->4)-alpha-D-glucan 1-alpha-D-glucosylmutase [Sphingomonas sp. NFR15]